MIAYPRQRLRELIREHGLALCRRSGELEDLLLAACPLHRREVSLLIMALRCQVAVDLAASSRSIPWPLLSESLLRRLIDQAGMTEVAACWALESWAVALGEITPPGETDTVCPQCKLAFGMPDACADAWLVCPSCSTVLENTSTWDRNGLFAPSTPAPAVPPPPAASPRPRGGAVRAMLRWLLALGQGRGRTSDHAPALAAVSCLESLQMNSRQSNPLAL
jgi:hypothetical protein